MDKATYRARRAEIRSKYADGILTDAQAKQALRDLNAQQEREEPRFALGRTVATPAALRVLKHRDVTPSELLTRHGQGDWAGLDDHDRRANEDALATGARILSSYDVGGGDVIWVITEADRSVTTLLLPSEY